VKGIPPRAGDLTGRSKKLTPRRKDAKCDAVGSYVVSAFFIAALSLGVSFLRVRTRRHAGNTVIRQIAGNVITNNTKELVMKRLKGKVAIVTGASKGIGAAIAEHLAAEGAAVVVNYATSKSGADAVAARIKQREGKAIAVQADVSKAEDIRRLFAEARKAFGQVDILVNNAGIYEFKPLEEITEEHFHRQFNLNVLGLLLASQEAAKQFGPAGGNIINISSVVATYALPNASVYSATKAAVDAITRSLAKELGPRKIRVNSINPGMVESEGMHTAGLAESDFRKQVEAQTPLGRIGQPADIAPTAVFLASDDSSWITGESFFISGGNR
jgi:3-oxoacyl-[acyl-carrier protein] reductase